MPFAVFPVDASPLHASLPTFSRGVRSRREGNSWPFSAAGGLRPGDYGLSLPTNCLPSDLCRAGSFTALFRVNGIPCLSTGRPVRISLSARHPSVLGTSNLDDLWVRTSGLRRVMPTARDPKPTPPRAPHKGDNRAWRTGSRGSRQSLRTVLTAHREDAGGIPDPVATLFHVIPVVRMSLPHPLQWPDECRQLSTQSSAAAISPLPGQLSRAHFHRQIPAR